MMNRFDGMKYHEIADKLSVSVKTVEANMGKALKLFRINLKQYHRVTC
jgi:RNA polymerase sigma-70 factor (ECF subfamily)